MADLVQILLFVLVSSLLGLTGGLVFLKNMKLAHRLSFGVVAFAIGAMLASGLLDFLPEALEKTTVESVVFGTLAGILLFFFIEKFFIWHHHHTYGETEKHSYNSLIIIGDTIHNFVDGVILAAAFMISPNIGIPAFLAIIFHEIPQEISDFGLLLAGGMRRGRIILVNIVSALFAVVGAVVAFVFISSVEGMTAPLLAFAAGAFIYIALSDLIPETKRTVGLGKSALQILLVIAGILVIWYTGSVAHEFFEFAHLG